MIGVTVIICCHNSSSRIEETLRHLASQITVDDLKWEVILIDNASTDDTNTTAKLAWSRLDRKNVEFTVAYESRTGLVHARKKGTDLAKYDIIIFCDDDNGLHNNYVQSSFELFQNSDVTIACGHGIATTPKNFPEWFQYVFTFYACHSALGIDGKKIEAGDLQYGAGIVIRKSFLNIIARCGYSYYLEDRSGAKLSSGQDTELILLAKILGQKVISSENLKFFHQIPESRLSKKYLFKLIKGVCSNGFKLEPFKIYLGKAKPLTNVTWLKDTCYVYRYFFRSIWRYCLKSSFQNKIELLANWHALQSSFSNYNKYKTIGNRLDSLAVNFRKPRDC